MVALGVYWGYMEYNLPRGYLSYSAMEMWKSSKDQFRMKYYSSEAYDLDTVYTRFGKEIAETLEDPKKVKEHPVLSKVPRYKTSEFPLLHTLNGVPIKGFIDSFDEKKKRIIEYKTGIRRANGAPPWDEVKVKKHNQTLLYSALVEDMLGEVHPEIKLVWMETCWKETPRGLNVSGPELQLTGHFEVFKRRIEEWEIAWIKKHVKEIAEEIHHDYTLYLQHSNKLGDKPTGLLK